MKIRQIRYRSILLGAGQVMFQQSLACSLCFLVGILLGAYIEGTPAVGWGALVGLCVSSVVSHLLSHDDKEFEAGLGGFNGILVGCGLMNFLKPSPEAWIVLLFASAAVAWIRHGLDRVMATHKINAMTLPFVLTCWMVLLAARGMEQLDLVHLAAPTLPHATSSSLHLSLWGWLRAWLLGISEVFLIGSWPTGICFLIGLWIANRYAALWAMVGSALALGLAYGLGCASAPLAEGLYGFSPVLTAIALGSTFYRPTWRTAIWCVAGIILTLFVQVAFDLLLEPVGLPAFTAPFCIATWLMLLPRYRLKRGEKILPEPDHTRWHRKGESSS